jgi:membrane associated rhomboid family serine protease
MSYQYVDDTEHPRITPAVQWLIAINVAIYLLQMTVVRPADMQDALGFEVGDLMGGWWKAFSYMFVHAGFWHLALNMFTLWVFGPRVEHRWGSAGFTRFYLLCGLGGWVAHLLFFRGALLVGASAAIFGVMYAFARQWPDEEILVMGVVPVKVKWYVAALLVLNLLSGIATLGAEGGTAYFAHLGGALAAWLYLRTPSAQGLAKLRDRIAQVPDDPEEPPRPVPKSLPRPRERSEIDDVVAKSKAIAAARRPTPVIPRKAPAAPSRSEELNLVLDKISERGIDSLTPAERKLLEEMSKKLRSTER